MKISAVAKDPGFILIVVVGAVLLFAIVSMRTVIVRAKVIGTSEYFAGTTDGPTGHIIGYNLTVEYDGMQTNMQVLCPLYPVGSTIQVYYGGGLFGLSYTRIIGGPADLPRGC